MLNARIYRISAAVLAAAVVAAGSLRADDAAREKERQYVGVLKSDAQPAEKAVACKHLAVYGSAEAVPELAKLLTDPHLSSWARIALEAIPGAAADDALTAAVPALEGELLVGTINSIGVRRSAGAVDLLIERLQNNSHEVVSASAVALGHIGSAKGTEALLKELKAGRAKAVQPALAEGCILTAEGLLKAGKADDAVKIYDEVRKADVPRQNILEATRGSILSRKAEGLPLLVEQLKSKDKAFYYLGLSAAREIPGKEVAEALVAELPKAEPERAAMMLVVLADRNETSQLPAVLKAAEKGPRPVRLAAVSALQRLGDVSCLPTLLTLSLDADEELALAAKKTAAELPGEKVDAEIVSGLAKADGKKYPLLIELVGQRRIEATAALIKALDSKDAVVRSAALTSLGETVAQKDLKVLVSQFVTPKNADDAPVAEKALKAASIRMPDREVCAAELSAALKNAPAPAKVALLQILGAVGGTKSLETIGAAAKSSDAQLQDTSSKLLGEWLNADPAPILLDLAKTAKGDKYQVRALRGYLRIAQQFAASDEQRAEMCVKALEAANHAAEKKRVLEVLKSKPHVETLKVAIKAMQNPELKEDATTVVMAIAQKLSAKGANVKELLAQAGLDPVKVEIVKAEYGTGSNMKDVTEALQKQVGELPLITLASPSYNASFGGDPAPGAVKQLKVQYKINGKSNEISFAEDAVILLPMPK